MNTKKTTGKKILALILSVWMILSVLPVSALTAFAEDPPVITPPASEQLDIITAEPLSNDWQVASGRYTGVLDNDTVIVHGDSGHLFRMRKNIVPADNENEMYVYLGVEPVFYHDWKTIFLGSGMCVNNANNELNITGAKPFGPDSNINTVKSNLGLNSHSSMMVADSKAPVDSTVANKTGCDIFVKNIYLCTDPTVQYTTDMEPDKSLFMEVADVNLVFSLPQNSAGSFTIVYCAPNSTTVVKLSNIYWDGIGRWDSGARSGADGGDVYFPYDAFENLMEANKTNFEHMLQRSFPEVVVDPMGDHVEFLNFEYCSTGLDTIDCTNDTITWDVSGKNSITPPTDPKYYEQIDEDDSFSIDGAFEAVYKIRLHNEDEGFVSWNGTSSTGAGIYPANDRTYLRYHTDEAPNADYNADFVVPNIRGYLRDIAFKKVDDLGNPLTGAEFALMHADECGICDNYVDIDDFTASSDENGNVVFSNVPSGHDYVLVETHAPTGFMPIEPHDITLADGVLTITGDAWNSDDHTIIDLRGMSVNIDKHATQDKLYDTGTSRVTLEVNSDPENSTGGNGSNAFVLDTMGAKYDLQTKATVDRFDGTTRNLADYNALPKITVTTYDKSMNDPTYTAQSVPGEWIYAKNPDSDELQSGYYGLAGITDYTVEKGAPLTEDMIRNNLTLCYKANENAEPAMVSMDDEKIGSYWVGNAFSVNTPGEYEYRVTVDNKDVGCVHVTVTDRIPQVTRGPLPAGSNWYTLNFDVATPKTILTRQTLTSSTSGNILLALTGNSGVDILYKNGTAWSLGSISDADVTSSGSFWNSDLTAQSTYTNYIEDTSYLDDYGFTVSSGTFKYNDNTYLGNNNDALAVTSSPVTWTVSGQKMYCRNTKNAARYLSYDAEWRLRLEGDSAKGKTFDAYVPTTVYTKTASADSGSYAVTGDCVYTIDQGADFDFDSVFDYAQIEFKAGGTGTAVTIPWDNEKVTYEWNTTPSPDVPGNYALSVYYDGKYIGLIGCKVIADSNSVSYSGVIDADNAAWKQLVTATAVPHTIYVRQAVTTSYAGPALVGNSSAVMFKDPNYRTTVSAYSITPKTNGTFWNADLTQQTTYSNYLEDSDTKLQNYVFDTTGQELKYSDNTYVAYSSSYAPFGFDSAANASAWQANGSKMNIEYTSTYVYQNGTSFYPTSSSYTADNMYFYVPTTVYTKSEGSSDVNGFVALTGTTVYNIGTTAVFDPDTYKSMAAVVFRENASSEPVEISWDDEDLVCTWNKPLDTHTAGNYVLSVSYKGQDLGTIEYRVSGRTPILISGSSVVDEEDAEWTTLAGQTAVPHKIYVRQPITADFAGDALMGNNAYIVYNPNVVSSYSGSIAVTPSTNGTFWNAALNQQTTYPYYIEDTTGQYDNYLFRVNNLTYKYLKDSTYLYNNIASSSSVKFDPSSAAVWRVDNGMLGSGSYNVIREDDGIFRMRATGEPFYLYVPTTVYTKTGGGSDAEGLAALIGTTKYYMSTTMDFNPDTYKLKTSVLYKADENAESVTVDWSDPDISCVWAQPLDMTTAGTYTLNVSYKGQYIGSIDYVVSETTTVTVPDGDMAAEEADYNYITIRQQDIHDYRLSGQTVYTAEIGSPLTEDYILSHYDIQLRTSLNGGITTLSPNLSFIDLTWDKPLNFRKAGTYYGTVTVYGVPIGALEVNIVDFVPGYHISDSTQGVNMETVTFNADGTEAYSDQLSGNIMTDGIIYGKYFTYNNTSEAVTLADGTVLPPETFKWDIGKIPTKIIELGYDVYLNGSMEGERDGGYYDTNEQAVLYYKDNDGVDKSLVYPMPNLDWGQTTIDYGLYLVDGNGDPIDLEGNPVAKEFYSVTRMSDTVHVNKPVNNSTTIDFETLQNLLPEGYYLYDSDVLATLRITSGGQYNYTNGSDTYVRIQEDGDTTLINDYGAVKDADGYIQNKTYYYSNELLFAVVKGAVIKPDTIVIDYGMPVKVNVLNNDDVGGTITGISSALTEGTVVNRQCYHTHRLADKDTSAITLKHGTAKLNNGVITYTPTDMQMEEADTVFYEYTAENGILLYTTVTVVPATIMYYEDDFVTFNDTTKNTWTPVTGLKDSTEQAQDRPGEYEDLAEDLDKNNVYGYDDANLACTTYSLGSARKVTVANGDYAANGNAWPTAQFTFTGTAFDIISASGGLTGFVTVYVYEGDAVSATPYEKWIVDTYYGYTRVQNGVLRREWKYTDHWKVVNTVFEDLTELPEFDPLPSNKSAIDTSAIYTTYEFNYEWQPVGSENALYQIPVIKSTLLPYGTYTVVIAPTYNSMFDHNYTLDANGKKVYRGNYDFYLDAIRTYAPAESYEEYNKRYYNFDGEGWPEFIEIRDNLIGEAVEAGTDEISGIMFIDSVAENASVTDYKFYGPNNEVYLDPGQAITFSLKTKQNERNVRSVQVGAKRLTGDVPELTVTAGTGSTARTNSVRITGSTDMYYKLCDGLGWASYGSTDDSEEMQVKSEQITITNTSKTASVSLTNIKITYFEEPETPIEFIVDGQGLTAAISIAALEYLASISECYHDFDFLIVTNPTETAEGLLRVICADCGETFDIVLPVLNEQNYAVITDVEPTATEDGRIIFRWVTTQYGEVEVAVTVPALGGGDDPGQSEEEKDPTLGDRIRQSIDRVLSFVRRLFEFITNLFKF